MTTRTHRYNFVRLDGGTSQAQRQPLVDKFNQEPNVFLFLISTTAGGLGLNLTAANKVVVFDPSWNPAHDLQAQDRAFRLGQKRHVAVYRLIALGTLEENVYERQVYKQQQVSEGDTEAPVSRLLWVCVGGVGVRETSNVCV